MKFFRLLMILALLLSALCNSAAAEYKKTKIAVLDFQQNGPFESPDVGKIVAEWFTTALVETGRFDIIERRLLQQLLEEQKMGQSGLIDPTSATKLGKVLGVATVVSGTVQNYDGNYEINARLINVESGSIIVAEKVRASSATRLTELVASIAARIIRNFPLQGYVVQRSEGRVLIDLGHQAGVRPGMQFSAYVEGVQIKHPRTKEVLDVERKERGVIRIDDVKEKTSGGIIVSENCTGCVKTGIMVRGILAEDEQRREAQLAADAEQAARQERERYEQEQRDRQRKADEEREKELRKEREQREKAQKEQREQREKAQKEQRQSKGRGDSPSSALAPLKTLAGHTGDIKSVAYSEDGTLAASGDRDKIVIVWDAHTWNKIATLKGHRNDVQALSFKHKGRFLAAGDRDETVIVWDLARSMPLTQLKAGRDVNAVDYNPSGTQLASGGNSKEITVWDTATWAPLKKLKTGNDVFALSYSPDGAFLAAGGKEKTVRLWRVSDESTEGRPLEGHNDDVRALVFSPGGSMLATAGDDKSIILWNVADGSLQKRLLGHDNRIIGLGISRDGHRLVSAESKRSEGLLIVWDVKSGRQIKRFRTDRKIEAMALSPDGRQVMVASDKQLLLYRLD